MAEDEVEVAGQPVQMSAIITVGLKEQLRVVAFERRMNMSLIVREALTEWFANHAE